MTTDEDNKRLKTELSEMKARHRLEIERVTREKEQEMDEVHKRFVMDDFVGHYGRRDGVIVSVSVLCSGFISWQCNMFLIKTLLSTWYIIRAK